MSSSSRTRIAIARIAASVLAASVWLTGHAEDPSAAAERGVAAARAGVARRGEMKSDLKLPDYDRARVQALSEQATKRGKLELDRLRAGNGIAGAMSPVDNDPSPSRPRVSGRVVVALSSSMPEAMLTSYFAQLDRKPESLVVLRGFIGGAHQVRPTGVLMEKIRRRITTDPKASHYQVETVVDPLLFRQLNLDQVPAVIWLGGVQELAHCDEQDYSKATVIYGAVSIEAALREARKAGADVPDTVIAKYRGTGWQHKP